MLQSYGSVLDTATGHRASVWYDVAKVWASVEPLSGREFIAAGASQSSITTRITIRHRQNVRSDMRVVHDNNVYAISAVLPDNDSGRDHLTLMCSEDTSNAKHTS